MSKPTHASVTDKPCGCNYLQNAANDSCNPITFDAETAEYQFTYDRATFVIYHCPFCGGAAPKSKRGLLFAQISDAEESRLAKLLDGIETIDDALERFGKPDFEGQSTTRHPEQENEAPRIQRHRDIRYHKLSDTAEIWITECPNGKIFWQLQGKYVGNITNADSETEKHPWWRFWR